MKKVLVTGAAGFIGHHLCNYLFARGHRVRAVDYKPPKHYLNATEENWQCDLRHLGNAIEAVDGVDWVFALAADMGGMGYIGLHHWKILQNNLAINLNTAGAAEMMGIQKVLYTSSACVYPEQLQESATARNLIETDAWQGKPDTAYGIEKLISEDIYALAVNQRIARLHNIMGPESTWEGGREKAPAALCRKVALAKKNDESEIAIWGDGQQTRSFCYIDDCLEMLYRLMLSAPTGPMNIGTDELTTIDHLADLIMDHAGVELEKVHDLTKPQGVRGRNADLTAMKRELGYSPKITLSDGIGRLYDWIERQV